MAEKKDIALETLDRGYQESKSIQLLQFLNDQAEISNRLKTCNFKENATNKGGIVPDARVSTAPESATRTYRLRPLSARPSTATGRQFRAPVPDVDNDCDNESVMGRRRCVGRKSSTESSTSNLDLRPETVCGFYDLREVDEQDEDIIHEVESDLDIVSVESITSTSPCDDLGDDDLGDITYEFDVPESDMCMIEKDGDVEPSEEVGQLPSARIKSSKSRPLVPEIRKLSLTRPLGESLPIAEPHPPPHRMPVDRDTNHDSNSTTTILRHMRARSSSSELHERGKLHSLLSKGTVWGDSTPVQSPATFRPPSGRTPLAATPISPMSPRISFEELPIDKQGMKLRTVARIDCDASFYRKLRHRSAPAIRTDELTTSRSEGNSPVRAKPVGVYHLPPLSKEAPIQPPASPHQGLRNVTTAEFLAQT